MIGRLASGVAWGLVGGAAGITALNLTTYADMAVRARPASSAPEDTVDRAADASGLTIPGDGEARQNRLSGLGALSGISTGVLAGGVYGLLRGLGIAPPVLLGGVLVGAAAMAASDSTATALDVMHPSDWSPSDWASDVVPHLAYGLVTAAVVGAGQAKR